MYTNLVTPAGLAISSIILCPMLCAFMAYRISCLYRQDRENTWNSL